MPMGTSIYRGSLSCLKHRHKECVLIPAEFKQIQPEFFREKARLSASFCPFVLSANLCFLEQRERVCIIKLFRMKV